MDEPSVWINLKINAYTWYEKDRCIFFMTDADRRASDHVKMPWFNLTTDTTFQLWG